jgi:hypothetical protein
MNFFSIISLDSAEKSLAQITLGAASFNSSFSGHMAGLAGFDLFGSVCTVSQLGPDFSTVFWKDFLAFCNASLFCNHSQANEPLLRNNPGPAPSSYRWGFDTQKARYGVNPAQYLNQFSVIHGYA